MNKKLLALAMVCTSTSVIAEQAPTYYADIRPLMKDKCLSCHTESSVSFSFEDAETAYALHPAIVDAVTDRRMPPWIAEPGHQEYVDDFSLSEEQIELFKRWADTGYTKGEKRLSRVVKTSSLLFQPDLTLEAQPDFAYLPDQENKDDYHCFLMDWPYQDDKYVTGFKGEPGNLRIAHHIVLFVVPPESVGYLKMLSESEEGPGHQCFGGVVPNRIADDDAAREQFEKDHPGEWQALTESYYWLAQWAPGTVAFEFPSKTGVLVQPGSVLVAQMHYYSAYAPGESDSQTRMQLKVSDSVERPSMIHSMSNGRWLYADHNQSMVIPAGETRTYEASSNFESIGRRAARVLNVDPEEIEAIELRSANLHMHAFGASGRISLQDQNGQKETLLNVPDWDLDWQRDFQFVDHKTIDPKNFGRTRLTVECTFSNYSEETVYGGYGSYDEMCFNFSYVSLVKKSSGNEGMASRATSP